MGVIPPVRNHRISNAGMSIKDVFNVNGGPNQIYGTTGQVNQSYEPGLDEEDRNSLRMTPRNQKTSYK